jgi:HK97 family phage portal protein
MTDTLPARFSDCYVVQAAASGGRDSAWRMASGVFGESITPARRHDDQYTLWNYVAIKRTADRLSEMTPHLGVAEQVPQGKSRRLTRQQQQWVTQSYGPRWLQSAEDWQPLSEAHPLARLLATVNDYQTWSECLHETAVQLQLHGQFFWWLIPNGLGVPVELHVIPRQWIMAEYERSGHLRAWRVSPPGLAQTMFLPPEQVIRVRQTHPNSKTEGWSALDAGERWVDSVDAIEASRAASYRNAVSPSILVEVGEQYGQQSGEQLERIKVRLMQRASGLERAGEPLIQPPHMKFSQWGAAPKEMDFADSMRDARDTVLALHGTPAIVAGLSTDYNRAVADAAALMWAETTLNPMARLIAGGITERLAPMFDDRIRCWFDDMRPANHEYRLKMLDLGLQHGAVTPDEMRAELDLPQRGTPAYQTGYLPVGRQPTDTATLDLSAADLPEDDGHASE